MDLKALDCTKRCLLCATTCAVDAWCPTTPIMRGPCTRAMFSTNLQVVVLLQPTADRLPLTFARPTESSNPESHAVVVWMSSMAWDNSATGSAAFCSGQRGQLFQFSTAIWPTRTALTTCLELLRPCPETPCPALNLLRIGALYDNHHNHPHPTSSL